MQKLEGDSERIALSKESQREPKNAYEKPNSAILIYLCLTPFDHFISLEDTGHSQQEERFYALGRTDRGRRLYAVFTLRGKMLRVITARDMSRKERRVYDSYEE
jgi:uncharacterized DUF497 family protein